MEDDLISLIFMLTVSYSINVILKLETGMRKCHSFYDENYRA